MGPGNGLLPDGTKPLPQLMLTYHERCYAAFNKEHFHKNCPWTCSVACGRRSYLLPHLPGANVLIFYVDQLEIKLTHSYITHFGLLTHICLSELSYLAQVQSFDACLVPNHCLDQWWFLNLTERRNNFRDIWIKRWMSSVTKNAYKMSHSEKEGQLDTTTKNNILEEFVRFDTSRPRPNCRIFQTIFSNALFG